MPGSFRAILVGPKAAALALATLLALLVVPLVFQLSIERLRAEIALVSEPARRAVSTIQLAHSLEVAAVRGYLLTGDQTLLGEYRASRRTEAAAFAALDSAQRELGPQVAERLETLKDRTSRWVFLNDRLASGAISTRTVILQVPAQQGRYRAVLLATEQLELSLVEYASRRRGSIQRLERIRTAVQVVLTLLTMGSALAVATLSGALTTQTELARRDPLTGLLNRRGFLDALPSRMSARAATLAYMDVDGFKAVNDLQGHDAGDRLLMDLGDAIRRSLGGDDLAGRMGGDEFAVLLAHGVDSTALSGVERLRGAVQAQLERSSWPVTLSVGAVTTTLSPGDDVEELIRRADELMYAGKRDGKNAIRYQAVHREATRF
jgi:diguanylate cyclase (GGDEF)-like protein